MAICGISVVDTSTVFASGTNYPHHPAALVKTDNGGRTWQQVPMGAYATLLVDCYFIDALRGWAVGGTAQERNPLDRSGVRAVVLYTDDGGTTWENRAADTHGLERGEWGWKIQFLNDQVGFVSLESFRAGAILKTTDGGKTWVRMPIHNGNGEQINANLEGVGFIDPNRGWVGGWGDRGFKSGKSSMTLDGGKTWTEANEIGRFINRFRFFGDPVTVGYASGRTVYKLSADAIPIPGPGTGAVYLETNEPARFVASVPIRFDVPLRTKHLSLDIWDRFGTHVRNLLDSAQPQAGPKEIVWDCRNHAGQLVAPGEFIYRLTLDGVSESRIIWLGP